MFGNELVKNAMIINLFPAQDINGAAETSLWVSMKNYGHATFVLNVGDTAGATFAVTFDQATDQAGTGSKTLGYDTYYTTGQRLDFTGRSAANFTVGETVSGTTSSNTAYVYAVSSDHLLIIPLTGSTTWTTTETLTGGTSGATASANGTGSNEGLSLGRTVTSDTVTIPAVAYWKYIFEIESDSLDVTNGFDCIQMDWANPGTSTYASGIVILTKPRYRGIEMPDALGTYKIT
jgi:hypothetical protein